MLSVKTSALDYPKELSFLFRTNGDGPAYNKDDMRLKEVKNAIESPHPDMPDEHPKVLLPMEEKLNQAMSFMRPD